MSGETIKRQLRAVPFLPFRFRMADGTHHAVRDPAHVTVVPRSIRIADGDGRPAIVLCPREIVAVDPL